MSDEFDAQRFEKGDFIFREGDPPGDVYLITKGTVEIFVINRAKGDEKIVLAERGFNQVLGEMALVDNKPRSANAVAIEETWCYVLSKEDFEKKLKDMDPFIRGIFQEMVVNLRDMNEKYSQEKFSFT